MAELDISFSNTVQQYVKNVALMNVMQLVKGEERWTMIDNHTWDMISGKKWKLPGALAPEIIELAKSKGYEFTDEDPQMNYPDELDKYRKEMDDNGWEYGEDEEELFELAMHDRQYRDYKSGVARNVLWMIYNVLRMRRMDKKLALMRKQFEI